MDYIQQNLNNLISMVDSIIRRDVDCSIDDILKSERLFISGSDASIRIQEEFSEKINKLGIFSQVIYEDEQISTINNLDVLICVSKCGEEKELISLAENFKKEGSYTISITNRQSTLAKYSDRIINIDYKLKEETSETRFDILFNQSIYILLDSVIESLSKRVPS